MGTSGTPVFAPDYYRDFHCIADRCRHSCCIGWEIDIDDSSLLRFQSVKGPLGEKLRANISLTPTPHFTLLGEAERCPFLNEKNLCELILGLGEDSICDICRDHPRFRSFYSDRIEIGLGLCCEEAARLLLLQKHPIQIVRLNEAGEADGATCENDASAGETDTESLSESEQAFFTWRAELFNIVFDPQLTLNEKMMKLSGREAPLFTPSDMARFGAFLMTLERLDPSWDQELQRLQRPVTDAELEGFESHMKSSGRQSEYDVLLWYFLFRHLPDGLTYDSEDALTEQVLFTIASVTTLYYLGAARYRETGNFTLDDQVELVRMYSSEIEYSDENVDMILGYLC